MLEEITDGLTAAQSAAVTHGEGPLLVIAGAGSGKTRVIERRVAWLVSNGVSPYEILGITFTNKAARELRERILEWVHSPRMWLCTFHSACARILRREIMRVPPFSEDFSIIDESDRAALLRDIGKSLGIDPATYSTSLFGDIISMHKNSRSAEAELSRNPEVPPDVMLPVYREYQMALEQSNSLDFDDLLLRTVDLFERTPEVLERYRKRFKHVVVDEYQDTNHVQYLLLKLLCGNGGNICAVGDPDQAIYGWRGADIGNILSFEKDFPGTKVVTLGKNFRSTNAILKSANRLIANNKDRYAKELYSDLGTGEPPALTVARDDEDEALRVAEKIHALVTDGGCDPGDCAIIYRTNAQSRLFEDACRRFRLPYTLVGAVAFYRRAEIKDIVAYLRVLVNPLDAISLVRVINRPSRGIGPTTLNKLQENAKNTGRAFYDVLRDAPLREELGKRTAFHIEGFISLLKRLSEQPRKPVAPLVKSIIEETGYLRQFDAKKSPEDAERVANVTQLVSDAARFDAEVGGDLRDFLENVALISDSDNLEGTGGAVTLLTFHSAKGLEFQSVFLVGLEEKLMPHERATEEPAGVEEERRLFYVGITRAKKHLSFSLAGRRRMYGDYSSTRPSRFLKECAALNITSPLFGEPLEPPKPPRATELPAKSNFDIAKFRQLAYGEAPPRDNKPLPLPPEAAADFKVGDIVEHESFGSGRIEDITGSGPSSRLKIFFRSYGVKVLVKEYAAAKLTIKRRGSR
ncbi:MAG: UvrD-helicase domain-containing protein [Candidatus Brocadiia bacterium]